MKDDTHKSLEHSKTCTSIPEAFLSGSKQLRTPAEALSNHDQELWLMYIHEAILLWYQSTNENQRKSEVNQHPANSKLLSLEGHK